MLHAFVGLNATFYEVVTAGSIEPEEGLRQLATTSQTLQASEHFICGHFIKANEAFSKYNYKTIRFR
ncbi:MAG: hypothetical protein Rhob2KO_49410 [Rhodopirellula baltica]|uniref:Uncharacterized protein n=1 Tax=Rhodopirellula bahusiensis TaxID=2014065 RepID=A0A2G1W3D1_9BACT|nr:hypothetical protein CEE69_22220 [Rhodopirellula bahusiensis]